MAAKSSLLLTAFLRQQGMHDIPRTRTYLLLYTHIAQSQQQHVFSCLILSTSGTFTEHFGEMMSSDPVGRPLWHRGLALHTAWMALLLAQLLQPLWLR